jgi:hypothetical protein
MPRLSPAGGRVLEPGAGLFVEALHQALSRLGGLAYVGWPETPEAGDRSQAANWVREALR